MKKIITPIIIFGMFFVGTSALQAQTQAELELQYKNLLIQLLEQLQLQLAEEQGLSTALVLDTGTVCGFAYMGSESIVNIQQELKNQGYSITKVDGKIGAETRAAVLAFQASVGAVKIDGLIGEEVRTLLMKESLHCLGDAGVTQSPSDASGESLDEMSATTETLALCSLAYNGSISIIDAQQELKNQGYSITKVDGKYGQETKTSVTTFQTDNKAIKIDGIIGEEVRVMLSRTSLSCTNGQSTTDKATDLVDLEIVTDDEIPVATTTEIVETSELFHKKEVTAEVRSTVATIPDDTAVFTYHLTITSEDNQPIYIPTQSDSAFNISLIKNTQSVKITALDSIVSSGLTVRSQNNQNYFVVSDGDTVSLRSSIQPGPGDYYAELARVTYTKDDVTQVSVPSMVNYGFDVDTWKTESITLQN
jgi:peptidoglycan hydrolase-like protein with peptidoglycan-binding domain